MTIVIHRKAPPLPFVPPELHGKLVVARRVLLRGPGRRGRAGRAAAEGVRSPVLDLCEPKPYLAHQAMFDPSFPHGWWYYIRACDVAELTDDVIDITVEHALRIRSALTTFPIWQLGGAVARASEDETAFNGRGAGHTFNITAITATAERLRRRARVVARLLVGARAVPHERLRQLPHGRGRGAGPRGLRRAEVRPAARRSSAATTPTTSSGSTRTSHPARESRGPDAACGRGPRTLEAAFELQLAHVHRHPGPGCLPGIHRSERLAAGPRRAPPRNRRPRRTASPGFNEVLRGG